MRKSLFFYFFVFTIFYHFPGPVHALIGEADDESDHAPSVLLQNGSIRDSMAGIVVYEEDIQNLMQEIHRVAGSCSEYIKDFADYMQGLEKAEQAFAAKGSILTAGPTYTLHYYVDTLMVFVWINAGLKALEETLRKDPDTYPFVVDQLQSLERDMEWHYCGFEESIRETLGYDLEDAI